MDKIRVLLVDDEKLERILIRKGFAWEEQGFDIVGEAESAIDALEIMRSTPIDLVITDINMPNITGLELSERIVEEFPTCYIVIITGYRDFEYARKAVKLQVEDYLLKPINVREIEKVASHIKEKIEKRKQQQMELERLKKSASPEEIQVAKQGNGLVEAAIDLIEKNYSNSELNLKYIAETIHTSESYLSRLFKKEVGVSLNDYMNQKRIRESLKLLRETDYRGYEIAERVGFNDAHYFSRCFKKYTGESVQDFRNRQ